MIAIESAIVELLKPSPPVAGGRIYHLPLPQDATLPAVTFQRISAVRAQNLNDGPAGQCRCRIQIDVWASTYDETKTVMEAIRAILDGYTGVITRSVSPAQTWIIQGISLVNDLDLFEDGRRIHRGTADYIVVYLED